MTALGGAEGQLTGALGRLFAVAEAYPDLKANQNMLALQEELSATENKIAFARQAYNDAVMFYNTQRELFPTTIIAVDVQLPGGNLFEIEQPEERAAPKCRSPIRLMRDQWISSSRQDQRRRQTSPAVDHVCRGGGRSLSRRRSTFCRGGGRVAHITGRMEAFGTPHSAASLWNPTLFAWVTLGTLLVISVGSSVQNRRAFRRRQNRCPAGGRRALDPQTSDLAERRLLNVVEEMALASGIPVPPVYRARPRAGHQRLCRRSPAGRCRGDRLRAAACSILRAKSSRA